MGFGGKLETGTGEGRGLDRREGGGLLDDGRFIHKISSSNRGYTIVQWIFILLENIINFLAKQTHSNITCLLPVI